MTRVQPRRLSPSLPVPSDTGGVHIWLILMKAHRALAYHAEQSIVGLGFCFSDFATLEALLHKGPPNYRGGQLVVEYARASVPWQILTACWSLRVALGRFGHLAPQGEVLAQALRVEGFRQPLLSDLQARVAAVLFDEKRGRSRRHGEQVW